MSDKRFTLPEEVDPTYRQEVECLLLGFQDYLMHMPQRPELFPLLDGIDGFFLRYPVKR